MEQTSKTLLELDANYSSTSSIESRLRFCKKDNVLHPQTTKIDLPEGKPVISSVPKSRFLESLKDFLPVMSEANKRLELAAVDNSKDFNIEALEDNDPAHIEMDLILGVADLHTPEAIATAKSAIDGHQSSFPSSTKYNSDEDDSDSVSSAGEDEEVITEENDGSICAAMELKRSSSIRDESSEGLQNKHSDSGKRPKIVELS